MLDLSCFQSRSPEEYEEVHRAFEEAGCQTKSQDSFVCKDRFESVFGWYTGLFALPAVTVILAPKAPDDPESYGQQSSARHERCSLRMCNLDKPFAKYARDNSNDTIHCGHNPEHATQARSGVIQLPLMIFGDHPTLKRTEHQTCAQSTEYPAEE